MAREKINISIDADLLKDIDALVISEERPSRSNAIEVLVRRGLKLPLVHDVHVALTQLKNDYEPNKNTPSGNLNL